MLVSEFFCFICVVRTWILSTTQEMNLVMNKLQCAFAVLHPPQLLRTYFRSTYGHHDGNLPFFIIETIKSNIFIVYQSVS